MGLQTRDIAFNTETFNHYYLCNYRPKSHGGDELSKSLISFKKAWPLHVDAWITCSVSELSKIEIGKHCLILRALSSTEEIVTTHNTPLDRLGREIAKKFSISYDPTILRKNRQTQKIKSLSAIEREQELSGAYTFFGGNLPDEIKEIFILDDILTTGATIRSMISAIRAVSTSCEIKVFTLAHTNQDSSVNKSIQLDSYPYRWELETGWNMVEESTTNYSTLAALQTKILNNAFE